MDNNLIPRKKSSDDSDPWILSYGDMVTNLLAFFILLFSLSSINKAKFEMLSQYFNKNNKDEMPLTSLTQKIADLVKQKNLTKDIKVLLTDKGVEVSFSDKVLFDLGKADLKPDAYQIIDSLIEILSTKEVKGRVIMVEGHTDGIPIVSKTYPSNWELSSARSCVIVRYFIDNGIDKNRMEARGYADTKPIVEEVKGKGAPENRRALMIIY